MSEFSLNESLAGAESTIDSQMARVAVLIPCYNEAATIASVVADFRKALPEADIYVYDNNSKDATCEEALRAGAIVRTEPQQGKGCVMRRMLSDINASVYITVDGDDTYDAASAPAMVRALIEGQLAMVVGRRVQVEKEAYRRGHVLGNMVFTRSVEWLFGQTFTDILSGYRVFSPAFVQSFPTTSNGFEIETELTVHALTLNLPAHEIDTPYKSRPEGSASKLHTYRDGWRIMMMILRLFRTERPQLFYTLISSVAILASVILIWPVILEFIKTGLVPRFPTAILSMGLAISALLSFACGLVLDTVTQGRREAKMLAYLAAKRAPSHSLTRVSSNPRPSNQQL